MELEWRQGVDVWPRYAAWSRIGIILAEYDGWRWVLSLALPEARFFATHEDWLECLYGPTPGGLLPSESGSAAWLKKMIQSDGVPKIDVEKLDQIAERRISAPIPEKWKVRLWWVGLLVGFFIFAWVSFAVKSPIASGAVGAAAVGILVALGGLWRVRCRRKKLGYSGKKQSRSRVGGDLDERR